MISPEKEVPTEKKMEKVSDKTPVLLSDRKKIEKVPDKAQEWLHDGWTSGWLVGRGEVQPSQKCIVRTKKYHPLDECVAPLSFAI